jgi:hypothetical protein
VGSAAATCPAVAARQAELRVMERL